MVGSADIRPVFIRLEVREVCPDSGTEDPVSRRQSDGEVWIGKWVTPSAISVGKGLEAA